ncbi:MAG: hypothetical protein HY044_02030 [Candidatus Woesebacteria bacterium]|nr:MAG: hypothetical protein HY044_02030 [Candidatus Woesebacteria bacterium]
MSYLSLFFLEFLIIFKLSRVLLQKLFSFFFKITKNEKLSIYIIAIIFLPGTFIHEMSHFLFALFLLVKTGRLRILPQIEGKEIRLGSLEIGKTDILRRNLIGIAPMVIGIAIIVTLLYLITQNHSNPFYVFLTAFSVFEISNTMYSSKKDLELALPLIILFIMLSVVLYILKVKISINLFQILSNEKLTYLLKLADIYLGLPIFINSALAIILR